MPPDRLARIENKLDTLMTHVTGDGNPHRGLLQRMARVEWIMLALGAVCLVAVPAATSILLWFLGPPS